MHRIFEDTRSEAIFMAIVIIAAVPLGKVKRISLVQEGLRRLRNTRPDLVPRLRSELLENLCEKMMISGYPEEFRAGVIRSAAVGYERLMAASASGERPLYRPRNWQQQARQEAKLLKRVSWYRPADTVLFLPATPGGELAEQARKLLEEEAPRLGMSWHIGEKAAYQDRPGCWRALQAAGLPSMHFKPR